MDISSLLASICWFHESLESILLEVFLHVQLAGVVNMHADGAVSGEVRWCSIPEPLGHGGFHRETMFDLENGYQHIMKVVSRGLDIQNLVV